MNPKIISRVAMFFAITPLLLLQPALAQDASSESQVSAAEADNALNRLSFGQW